MRIFDRDIYEVYLEDYQLDECQREIEQIPIEGLILRCTEERRFDIGALCYQNRIKITRAVVKKVDLYSLRKERTKAIRAWVVQKITLFYTSISAATIYHFATELTALFDWADSSDFEELLVSPEKYHEALQAYTQNLNRQIGKEKSRLTASRRQSMALHSGPIFFPETAINFRDDLPIISNKGETYNPTEPPLQQEIEAYLTPCQYLFDGLTDFVLGFEKFPAKIPFMTEYLWLLPAEYPVISKRVYSETTKARSNIVWDYENGQIRTFEEAVKLSIRNDYQVNYELEVAHTALYKANLDQRHAKRMKLARIAHDAFISLFVANSGMNEQPLRDLLYNCSYETFESSEKGFIGIKIRADGREVKFSIKKTFTKHFDKFIRLRRFIDEESRHRFLFMGMSAAGDSIGGQVGLSAISRHNERIKRYLIPDFKGLTYRKLRKYKSNYLLSQGHSVQIVSALLQTNEQTILNSYAQANEGTAIAEITAMMKRLVELLNDYSGEETPAGDCADIAGRSEVITPPPDYEPNCKNFEGCIFCSQFRTHATEPSIRKLLSMRFVTLEYLNSCADKSHFDKVHGAAIAQIDRIILELREHRPDLSGSVDKISAEISTEFKLSDYWKRFYHRMVQLKVMK
ncbi:hypothetical protein [Pseudomonas sp. 008]|uniref:hypothetical protein n=1 Tax=Pseudomonas sp. 008 TaxID=2803906 RepID=UPI001951B9B0|nr:hypothetical protein [Pseudomonas sp. 008]GID06836.1 hypothetical protein TMM008_40380 [Pseudomonas sp. 008]